MAGQPVNLIGNYYKLKLKQGGGKTLNKYAINYEPDVPDNSKLGRKLTSLARDTLRAKFENYICWGNNIFSFMRITDNVEADVEHDG